MTFLRQITAISTLLAVLPMANTFAENSESIGSNYWYLGLNTGASFVHNQSSDEYFATSNTSSDFRTLFREDHSQRGFNGGAFIGWNFWCCDPFSMAVELSGNLYSNRGHYTIDFIYPYTNTNNNNSRNALYEVNYDMDYSFHLTARPGFMINQTTLFYFQFGAAYAHFNSELEFKHGNLTAGDPIQTENDDWFWGVTLGAGLKKQLNCHFSVFAAYEYTYYGRQELNNLSQRDSFDFEEEEGTVNVINNIRNREAKLDSNTFKAGIVFNF